MNIGVLGQGRFGSHLIYGLEQLGFTVGIYARETPLDAWVSDNQVLCLACRDDQLAELVGRVAASNLEGKTLLMHSGTTPLSLLEPAAAAGATIGKFHPLMAFTGAARAPIPAGTPFAVEGAVWDLVKPWADAWQCKCYALTGADWQRYHLAAVLSANFLPLFVRAGSTLLGPLAEDEQDALDWLGPLVRQTIEDALNADYALPYSGPAVRGDTRVLNAQENLLETLLPEMRALYTHCSQAILKQAEDARGASETNS